MSSNPLRLDSLFRKYLSNSCTQEELNEFWKLMSELSNDDLLSLGLYDLWHGDNPLSDETTIDWNLVYERLQERMESSGRQWYTERKIVRLQKRPYYRAAAAIIICSIGLWSLWYYRSTPSELKGKDPIANARPSTTPVRTITLPDQTVVTLRGDSRLTYPKTFSGKTREVYLSGEAYFDVKHDAKKLFIVHTGHYNTIVMGTAFNIKANTSEKVLSLTVTRGKVRLEREGSNEVLGVLRAEDQITIDESVSSVDNALLPNVVQVNTETITDWVKQDIVFNNSDWQTASLLLEKQYGVKLKFDSEKLLKCRFTGDFAGKTLSECLDILCALTKTQWKSDGVDTIRIEGDGCDN